MASSYGIEPHHVLTFRASEQLRKYLWEKRLFQLRSGDEVCVMAKSYGNRIEARALRSLLFLPANMVDNFAW